MDVIGIGFLNIDYIKSMPWLPSHATQLLHQEFEPGKEETLSDENISQRIRKIGTAGFDYIGPGGSAFNTIRCIAQLDMGIRVGYIGVLGEPDDGCDLKQSFLKYSIDSTWIFESTKPCGKSLSLYWPREQARSLRTASGANVDLKAQLSSPVIQEEVITYLAGAKWVHVTGLEDDASLSMVQDLIVRAKQANPRLVLSFDPGSEYCRNPTVAVREMIKIADYLLVNSTEFRQLGGYEEDQQIKGNQTKEKDIATEVFQSFVGPRLMIVLKSYNAISFFQTYKEGVFLRRYWHTPLLPPMIRDDTGAGDVFAAGFIVSQLTPALSFDMKTALAFCSRLVKTKLRMLGCDAEAEYQVALKQVFEEIKRREHLSYSELATTYLGSFTFFVLGAIFSAIISALISKLF